MGHPPRRCGDCQCFKDPPVAADGRDAILAAAAGVDKGDCLRFPQPLKKRPDDFCFEFIVREGVNHAR